MQEFARGKHGAEFWLGSKIDVNGKNTHPVYSWLKEAFPGDVTWNFHARFIVDRNGVPVARFNKKTSWKDIDAFVAKELAEQATPPAADSSADGQQN